MAVLSMTKKDYLIIGKVFKDNLDYLHSKESELKKNKNFLNNLNTEHELAKIEKIKQNNRCLISSLCYQMKLDNSRFVAEFFMNNCGLTSGCAIIRAD